MSDLYCGTEVVSFRFNYFPKINTKFVFLTFHIWIFYYFQDEDQSNDVIIWQESKYLKFCNDFLNQGHDGDDVIW